MRGGAPQERSDSERSLRFQPKRNPLTLPAGFKGFRPHPHRTCTRNAMPVDMNGSVHTAHKQHQWICVRQCGLGLSLSKSHSHIYPNMFLPIFFHIRVRSCPTLTLALIHEYYLHAFPYWLKNIDSVKTSGRVAKRPVPSFPHLARCVLTKKKTFHTKGYTSGVVRTEHLEA